MILLFQLDLTSNQDIGLRWISSVTQLLRNTKHWAWAWKTILRFILRGSRELEEPAQSNMYWKGFEGETLQTKAIVFRAKGWVSLGSSRNLMVQAKLPFHLFHASFELFSTFSQVILEILLCQESASFPFFPGGGKAR